MGRSNHGYDIYKKYSIDDIRKAIEIDTLPDNLLYHDRDHKDSLKRVKLMLAMIDRDGNECIYCKIKPEYFALGKDKIGRWHLDLYCNINDEAHMFTIDHIHPKSKGGKNELENYQLLCKICNEDKGDSVNGELTVKKKKISKSHYIDKKLVSLTQQIKGIFLKLKNHKLVCINSQKNFTIDKEYEIIDIRVKIDEKFDTKYTVYIKNDLDNVIKTSFKNFVTLKDFEIYKQNK